MARLLECLTHEHDPTPPFQSPSTMTKVFKALKTVHDSELEFELFALFPCSYSTHASSLPLPCLETAHAPSPTFVFFRVVCVDLRHQASRSDPAAVGGGGCCGADVDITPGAHPTTFPGCPRLSRGDNARRPRGPRVQLSAPRRLGGSTPEYVDSGCAAGGCLQR